MTTTEFQLYTRTGWSKLPGPKWQITSRFSVGDFVGLYGPSGHGKTFVALDMSLSISQGVPWQGHPTKQGAVIYVAAEGGPGVLRRVNAWCEQHKLDVSNAFFLLRAVQFRYSEDMRDLAACIDKHTAEHEIPPTLIVSVTKRRGRYTLTSAGRTATAAQSAAA